MTSALEFPCSFPIKIIGKRQPELESTVVAIVKKHAPDQPLTILLRPSEQRNYLALTITLTAHSQAQLDQIYLELSACPLVIMTL